MSKIIVEFIKNTNKEHGCWGIQIRPEGGSVFVDTGYIYEGEGSANRAFCKLLEELPSDNS
jgi:hypothetical protein